jgi:hypothetical protein
MFGVPKHQRFGSEPCALLELNTFLYAKTCHTYDPVDISLCMIIFAVWMSANMYAISMDAGLEYSA